MTTNRVWSRRPWSVQPSDHVLAPKEAGSYRAAASESRRLLTRRLRGLRRPSPDVRRCDRAWREEHQSAEHRANRARAQAQVGRATFGGREGTLTLDAV